MATIRELAALSDLVYRNDGGAGDSKFPAGWEILDTSGQRGIGGATGYFAVAYLNRDTREIVIAHRGTEFTGNDWAQNIAAAIGKAPTQYPDALLFYESVKALPGLAGFSISHTGHSLGGGLANMMAAKNPNETAVGFNSIGVSSVLTQVGLDPTKPYLNILNISAYFDPAKLVGSRIGQIRNVSVSSLPLVPDFLEPLLAGAAVAKLGPIGKVLLGLYLKSQHKIENMLDTVEDLPKGFFTLPQPEVPLSLSLEGAVSGAGASETQDFESALDSNADLRALFSGEAYFSYAPLSGEQVRLEQAINDTLSHGYIGDDTPNLLVGSDGADTLEGRGGADIIFGDEGTDVIRGGEGADFLIGGKGRDVYQWNSGDGTDVIIDSDHNGTIVINSRAVSLAFKDATGSYKTPDGTVTLTQNSPLTIRDASGGSIVIEGWQTGDLGIRLKDALQNPLTTLDITGDALSAGSLQSYQASSDDILREVVARIEFVSNHPRDGLGNVILDYAHPAATDDTLSGSSGNDHIMGGGGADFLSGGGGADRLEGNDGRDVLSGGAGSDLLEGGAEADYLSGGDGNDQLFGNAQVTTAQAINDTSAQPAGERGDWIDGDAGDDIIVGSAGDDILAGGAGEDLLIGGAGNDAILGDYNGVPGVFSWTTYRIPGTQDQFIGPLLTGTDVIDVNGGADTIYAGAGDDFVLAELGDDTIFGESGNDRLIGGAGSDTILGGTEDDFLSGDGLGVALSSQGDDYLDGGDGNDQLKGDGGDDYLDGGSGKNTLDGGGGDDILIGTDSTAPGGLLFAGSSGGVLSAVWNGETLIGGGGDDTIYGGANAYIDGGPGNDTIDAGGGDGRGDVWGLGIYGGAGNDIMVNGGHMYGGAGDDALIGMDSAPSELHGGEGNDTLTLGAGGGQAFGDAGNDNVTVTEFSDNVYGGAGNDTIDGLGGNDAIFGGAGDDALSGGDGNDILQGEGLNDQSIYSTFNTIYSLTGDDTLDGGAGNDNLAGSHGNDSLIGGEGDDFLYGDEDSPQFTRWNFRFTAGSGDDILNGGVYDDYLWGYAGDDTLNGGAGNDELGGDLGNDTLTGGTGSDYLAGGLGNDIYVFNLGDGQDTLDDSSGSNVVRFGDGIAIADINAFRTIQSDGREYLVVSYSASDSIVITNGLSSFSPNRDIRYEFADGTALTHDQLLAMVPAGDQTYTGPVLGRSGLEGLGPDIYQLNINGDDVLDGGAGNDFLRGFAGADQLLGGAGRDELIGDRGNDIVNGGADADFLAGGDDNDTYVFNSGDGADTIEDAAGTNTLSFGAGIAAGNLSVFKTLRDGTEYVVIGYGANDSVAIKHDRPNPIQAVSFADGSSLDWSAVLALAPADDQPYDGAVRHPSELSQYTNEFISNFTPPNFLFPRLKIQTGDVFDQLPNPDRVVALDGPSLIATGLGDDYLDGGAGDDWLYGGSGNDVYVFGRGYGKDRVIESFLRGTPPVGDVIPGQDPLDTIRFDSTVAPSDITVTQSNAGIPIIYGIGAGFSFWINGTNDAITTESFFTVERAEFADGTVWDGPEILARSLIGDDGPNPLFGFGADDNIVGNGGDDFLSGAAGNDTLNGGTGNDQLDGGAGDDIYVFNAGDGHDTLSDDSGIDTIRFGAGVTPGDLQLKQDGNDLIVQVGNDSMRILAGHSGSVEKYEFADGTILTHQQLFDAQGRLHIDGTPGQDFPLLGTMNDDLIDGKGGGDLLVGRGGDDVYVFNAGYGATRISDLGGADEIRFGPGIASADLGVRPGYGGPGSDGLLITIGNLGDSIIIGNGYNGIFDYYQFSDGTIITRAQGFDLDGRIERYVFDGGSTLDLSQLLTQLDTSPILGTDGGDFLTGTTFSDTFQAGAGDDYLQGFGGGDSFIFNMGDGADTISTDSINRPGDVVQLGDGINLFDVKVNLGTNGDQFGYGGTFDGTNNLGIPRPHFQFTTSVALNASGDSISFAADIDGSTPIITDPANLSPVGTFQFAAGYNLSVASLLSIAPDLSFALTGFSGPNLGIGFYGNDSITVFSPNPGLVLGGAGSDVITLGSGKSVVLFNAFDGFDSLMAGSAGATTLSLGGGVDYSQLALERDASDLLLDVGFSGQIRLSGYFDGPVNIGTLQVVNPAGYDPSSPDPLFNRIVQIFDFAAIAADFDAAWQADPGIGMWSLTGALYAHTLGGSDDAAVGGKLAYEYGVSSSLGGASYADAQTILNDPGFGAPQSLSLGYQQQTIYGTNVDDTLIGASSGDVIYGFAGNDYLDGGPGVDAMAGGLGDDTYVIDNIFDSLGEVKDAGTDTVILQKNVPFALPGNFENLMLAGSEPISGFGNSVANVITGNSAGNYLDGGGGDDVLSGGEGNDQLYGGDGNDVLNGDAGDDTLDGAAGDDTYRFDLGGGHDTLFATSGADALEFGAGISAADIGVARDGADLLLNHANGADQVRIKDWYLGTSASPLTRISFADGGEMDLAAVRQQGLIATAGTDGTVTGVDNENNTLLGDGGSNIVTGGNTDDVLAGGAGDDLLAGGAGSDTYQINPGDGVDHISELPSLSDVDSIDFGPGIDPDSLSLGLGSLLIRIGTTGQEVHIDNFDPANADRPGFIELFNFADGTTLNFFELLAKGFDITGTDADDILTGTNVIDRISGLGGNDRMEGGSGGDSYLFDAGFGYDAILDAGLAGDAADEINFGNGISPNQVQLSRVNGDLVLAVNGGTDAITVEQFYDPDHQIEFVKFADGTTWDAAYIESLTPLPNHPPILANAIGDQSVDQGAAFQFQAPLDTFTDPDAGDSLAFTATLADGSALPAWLNFDPTAATFDGTPQNEDVGSYSIRLTATDSGDLSASDTFDVTVANLNDAPTVANAIADQTTDEDAPFAFTVPANAFSDVDAPYGDTLAYTATRSDGSALPGWLAFDAATRTFSGTPLNADVGTVSINVTATDGSNASAFDTFDLTVINTNDAPLVAHGIAAQVATEDTAYSFTVPADVFTDEDAGDALTYVATRADGSALPTWIAFDPATSTFSGTPTNSDVGTIDIKLIASDTANASAATVFAVSVANVNDAPTVNQPTADQVADVGAPFMLTLAVDAFADIDAGDTLTYSARLLDGSLLPAWLAFNAATGSFTGTPASGDAGVYSIAVTATDTGSLSATDVFDLSVIGAPTGLTLIGTPNKDVLTGGAGDDTLDGRGNADRLIGNGGNDTFLYFGDAQWSGGFAARNDGSPGNPGTRKIVAIAGKNRSYDVFEGGPGTDVLLGTAGNDALFLDDRYSPFPAGRVPRLAGIERIEGGAGNDVIDLTSSDYAYGDVTLDGGDGNDVLWASSGDDVLLGGFGNDDLFGGAGRDFLAGGTGNDTVNGDRGNDLLEGDDGNDALTDNFGNNLLYAGGGNDQLTGGSGNEIFAGGQGNDTLATGQGADIVAFNRGDGQDTVKASTGADNTVSLGGGIRYADLTLTKSGNNLVLDAGSDRLTLQNWYASPANRGVLNLQMVAEAMNDFAPGGTDALRDNKIERFDFRIIVQQFDEARAAAPSVNHWAVMNALLDAHLGGSDTEALGGDLAYRYGLSGSLAGIGSGAAQNVLSDPQFGSGVQTLQPLAGLQEGLVKLG